MKNDERWELLIEGMWRYQWTKNEVAISQEFIDVLYDESQGIVDIAVKLYAMAQMKAIASGKEIITPTLIKQVAKENLKLVKPMLDALRFGDKNEISRYGDIQPIDIDAFCDEQRKALIIRKLKEKKQISISSNQAVAVATLPEVPIQKFGGTVNQPAKKPAAKEPDDLRYIVEEGRKERKSAYEALKSKGVIKNPVEEFLKIG